MQMVLQDTSQSQLQRLQESAALPDGSPIMKSAFQAAAQQVFNSPPQPLMPGPLVQPDPEPTPGSLESVSLSPHAHSPSNPSQHSLRSAERWCLRSDTIFPGVPIPHASCPMLGLSVTDSAASCCFVLHVLFGTDLSFCMTSDVAVLRA